MRDRISHPNTATVQPIDNKGVNGDVAVVAVKEGEGKPVDDSLFDNSQNAQVTYLSPHI